MDLVFQVQTFPPSTRTGFLSLVRAQCDPRVWFADFCKLGVVSLLKLLGPHLLSGSDVGVQTVSFYRAVCSLTLYPPFKNNILFSSRGQRVYAYLNSHLDLIKKAQPVGFLTVDLHVWPDFHGNRSPLADLTLKGMVSNSQFLHEGEGGPKGSRVGRSKVEEKEKRGNINKASPQPTGFLQMYCC